MTVYRLSFSIPKGFMLPASTLQSHRGRRKLLFAVYLLPDANKSPRQMRIYLDTWNGYIGSLFALDAIYVISEIHRWNP